MKVPGNLLDRHGPIHPTRRTVLDDVGGLGEDTIPLAPSRVAHHLARRDIIQALEVSGGEKESAFFLDWHIRSSREDGLKSLGLPNLEGGLVGRRH